APFCKAGPPCEAEAQPEGHQRKARPGAEGLHEGQRCQSRAEEDGHQVAGYYGGGSGSVHHITSLMFDTMATVPSGVMRAPDAELKCFASGQLELVSRSTMTS